jgi:hypothetical protein
MVAYQNSVPEHIILKNGVSMIEEKFQNSFCEREEGVNILANPS